MVAVLVDILDRVRALRFHPAHPHARRGPGARRSSRSNSSADPMSTSSFGPVMQVGNFGNTIVIDTDAEGLLRNGYRKIERGGVKGWVELGILQILR
jgi:hypothetical protein